MGTNREPLSKLEDFYIDEQFPEETQKSIAEIQSKQLKKEQEKEFFYTARYFSYITTAVSGIATICSAITTPNILENPNKALIGLGITIGIGTLGYIFNCIGKNKEKQENNYRREWKEISTVESIKKKSQ